MSSQSPCAELCSSSAPEDEPSNEEPQVLMGPDTCRSTHRVESAASGLSATGTVDVKTQADAVGLGLSAAGVRAAALHCWRPHSREWPPRKQWLCSSLPSTLELQLSGGATVSSRTAESQAQSLAAPSLSAAS